MLTILSFIFVFGIVAIAHELGHMLWAKRVGIRVYEFGLGFGPKLFGVKWQKTEYSLRLFPLGGFVRIAGIEGDTEEERLCPEEEKYTSKPWSARFNSILAGPIANLALALIIFWIIFSFVGIPSGTTNEIETVVPNSPAAQAGLRPGDKIIALNGKAVTEIEKTIAVIHKSAGKILTLTISRGEQKIAVAATPKYDPQRKMALLGFSPKLKYTRCGMLPALGMGLQQILSLILAIFQMLGMLIAGQAGFGDLMGPVGIAQFSGQIASQGLAALFHFIAVLSVMLGAMNLLPLPALDGGRLFLLLVEKIRGKALEIKKENMIHTAGLAALIILSVFVAFNDVRRILGK